MSKPFLIKGIQASENITFWILNNKSTTEIETDLIHYCYHNLVYLLLLIIKIHQLSDTTQTIDYLEHLEENQLYWSVGVIDFITPVYPEPKRLEQQFHTLQLNTASIFNEEWKNKIIAHHTDWLSIVMQAKELLLELNIPVDTDLEEYAKKYLDDSFLF